MIYIGKVHQMHERISIKIIDPIKMFFVATKNCYIKRNLDFVILRILNNGHRICITALDVTALKL